MKKNKKKRKNKPRPERPLPLKWDFEPGTPTDDFFEGHNLADMGIFVQLMLEKLGMKSTADRLADNL